MTDPELEKYIGRVLSGSVDPFEDVLKIILQIHHMQVSKLQAEIADLKQEIKGLEGKK